MQHALCSFLHNQPQIKFDQKKLLAHVGSILDRKGHCVICVAEGAGQVTGLHVQSRLAVSRLASMLFGVRLHHCRLQATRSIEMDVQRDLRGFMFFLQKRVDTGKVDVLVCTQIVCTPHV
jgi:hypothetical protein